MVGDPLRKRMISGRGASLDDDRGRGAWRSKEGGYFKPTVTFLVALVGKWSTAFSKTSSFAIVVP